MNLRAIQNLKDLIGVAAIASCDYVEFQKRYLELGIPDIQKNCEENPFLRNQIYNT